MLLIYLPVLSSRSEYIFELIFKQELGIAYGVTTDRKVFEAYQQEKINYSQARTGNEFFIRASPLLFEDLIKKADIIVEDKYQTKVLFPNDASCDMGFDIFAAIFFMVSRYEEYLPFTPDKYGRLKGTDTIAYKNNFLQIPVADVWTGLLKKMLQKKFPAIKFRRSNFKALLTYDIDVAYKYKGRNFARTTKGILADLVKFDFKNIYRRYLTLNNKLQDPWDVYDHLHEMIERNNLDSIFFFLLSDGSTHDRNLNYKNPMVKKLIDTIRSFSKIGIHPSYATSSFPEKINQEKKRLENLSGRRINKSRQHFLKFTLPETYNALIEAGITEDYSLGFTGLPGFRAGTCKPFYFYDLKNERSTTLKVFPITMMDGAYMDYMVTTPSHALQEIYTLVDAVNNVNGIFICIWHNHTISKTTTYSEWRKVHDKMVQYIAQILRQQVSG